MLSRRLFGAVVVLSALLMAALAAFLLARPARDALGIAVTRSFAAGGSTLGGVIIATDDGWRTWSAPYATMGTQIYALAVASPQDLVAAGADRSGSARLFSSRDGGHRWSPSRLPAGAYALYGLGFRDALHGYAAGTGPTGGILLETLDAGQTWKLLARMPGMAAYAVAFVSPREGWVSGRSTVTGRAAVLHSKDGGRTWQGAYSGGPYTLAAMRFVNARNGFAAGYGSGYSGVVVATHDGGRTWRVALRTNRSAVFGLSASGPKDVWVSGMGIAARGFITHSSDGGRTWRTLYQGGSRGILAVSFRTPRDGYAIGSNATDRSLILATLDGGQTWVSHPVSVAGNAFFGLY